MYDLLFSDKATKSLKEILKNDAKRILTKIDDLASDPDNVKKLVNHPKSGFRLRVGSYRVLFDKYTVIKIFGHSILLGVGFSKPTCSW